MAISCAWHERSIETNQNTASSTLWGRIAGTYDRLARIEGRNDLDKFLAERTARIPIGKRIEPEEVAKAVLWLAFDAPNYITAERLNVSGGLDKD